MNRNTWHVQGSGGRARFVVHSDEAGAFALITPPAGCTGSVEVWQADGTDTWGVPLALRVTLAHDADTCPIHEHDDEEDNDR